MAQPCCSPYQNAPYNCVRGGQREHVAVAERALGKPLPRGAEVHHVDGDKRNNACRNLVICQDHAYHCLLEIRARVLVAGGDPNRERLCADCKRLVPMSDFAPAPRRIDGIANQCRPCKAANANQWYHDHRLLSMHRCECGCGERTYFVIVVRNKGQERGMPLRFRHGHNHR